MGTVADYWKRLGDGFKLLIPSSGVKNRREWNEQTIKQNVSALRRGTDVRIHGEWRAVYMQLVFVVGIRAQVGRNERLTKQVTVPQRALDKSDGSRAADISSLYQWRFGGPATTTPAVHAESRRRRRRPRSRRRSSSSRRQLSVHRRSRRGVPPAAVTSCQTQELLLG